MAAVSIITSYNPNMNTCCVTQSSEEEAIFLCVLETPSPRGSCLSVPFLLNFALQAQPKLDS